MMAYDVKTSCDHSHNIDLYWNRVLSSAIIIYNIDVTSLNFDWLRQMTCCNIQQCYTVILGIIVSFL